MLKAIIKQGKEIIIMVYAIGRADAAYRMMNTADSQLSSLRSIGSNYDVRVLNELQKRDTLNAINMQKDELMYKLMDRLDKMDKKIKQDKFERSTSTFNNDNKVSKK